MWQMAVLLAQVQAVTDDEAIVERKADVIHRDIRLAVKGLTQEGNSPQRSWLSCAKKPLKVGHRQSGVDDVFDDHDVPVEYRRLEVLKQPDFTRAGRPAGIARNGDEIQSHGSLHKADQVCQKHERTLQNCHEMHAVGIVAIDLGRELGDALPDLVRGE